MFTPGTPTTSPVTVIQEEDMTTDIVACTRSYPILHATLSELCCHDNDDQNYVAMVTMSSKRNMSVGIILRKPDNREVNCNIKLFF